MLNPCVVWGMPHKVYKTNDGYLLNLNVEQVDENYYRVEQVSVPEIKYDTIVATLVDAKYTSSDITAITLNYFLVLEGVAAESKMGEYTEEYQQLQAWRNTAKTIAKDVIEYVNEHNIA